MATRDELREQSRFEQDTRYLTRRRRAALNEVATVTARDTKTGQTLVQTIDGGTAATYAFTNQSAAGQLLPLLPVGRVRVYDAKPAT